MDTIREGHSRFLNEFQLVTICACGAKASELGKPPLYFWQPATTTGHVNDLLKQRV